MEDLALQANDFACGPHATLTHFGLPLSTAMGPGSGVPDIHRRVAAKLPSPAKGSSRCAKYINNKRGVVATFLRPGHPPLGGGAARGT